MRKNNLEVIKNDFTNVASMPKDERDIIIQQLMQQNLNELSTEMERIKTDQNAQLERIEKVESDVKNKITLDYGQQAALQHAKKKRVEELWKVGGEFTKVLDTKRKLHARAWSELYRTFGVASYRDVKSKDFNEAVEWIQVWRPQMF
ncbi:MAG TPA: ORF6C domain-containing protein [Pseudogracilibacillus sp.]|nr:ORF6C domain-containing protein [Pseudogracilibacillus sp.]